MKPGIVFALIYIYHYLLRLYPADFLDQFGNEMEAVFAESISEAARVNQRTLFVFILRELRDYPSSLLRQHWRNIKHLEPILMTSIKKPEWFFYPAWIILTTLCIPIAFILSLFIVKVIVNFVDDFIYVDGVRHITEDYLGTYIFIPVVSLLTGVMQYGLLRRYLPRMGWWVLATTGGWLLGMLLIFGWLSFWAYDSRDMDLGFIVLGLSIGVGQWLLLRRRLLRAGWWIVASVVGWGLFGLIMGGSFGQFGLIVLGLLPACVTAAMLALLMNRDQPSEMQDV